MKALTAAEMREVDRLTTERYGIPSLQLMENAGGHVAGIVRDFSMQWPVHRPRRVAVLCGKGNNGGDGFVVARHLAEGDVRHEVRVYLFASPQEVQGDSAKNFLRWKDSGGAVTIFESQRSWEDSRAEVASAPFVVDALLGTGLRGGASGLIAQAIEDLNRISANATRPTPAFVVAVDTPSGLPSDGEAAAGPVVRAHATVTFTAPKVGQLISPEAPCCGRLHVKSIGSPLDLIEEVGKGSLRWAGPDEFASLPLVRLPDAHKGSFGHVLIVGGSIGKSGAAALAGYASLCAGAGLTTIASPDVVQPVIASAHSEYMTEPLTCAEAGTVAFSNVPAGRLAQVMEGKTVLALGPGMGTHPETQRVVQHLVRESSLPIILDADGLNAFSGKAGLLRERKSPFLAITPHPGEMGRLLGATSAQVQSNRIKAATDVGRLTNAHVILKGFHSVLASPDGRVWINTTGGPELAKGGSGDVLTGALAALTAQFGTGDWLRILALGTYLHGAAGQATLGYQDASGVLAGGVAHAIPMARKALAQEIRFGA
jgi:NAD(P)H-hydrate epimerase